jgi:hypothetical protein
MKCHEDVEGLPQPCLVIQYKVSMMLLPFFALPPPPYLKASRRCWPCTLSMAILFGINTYLLSGKTSNAHE